VNCFIPRFDLEEDAHFYYLGGEIPRAKAEDITIEPRDSHTLVIYGSSQRHSTGHNTLRAKEDQTDNSEHSASPPAAVSTEGRTEHAKCDPASNNEKPGLTS
jgi:HSP20 family protein